MWETLRKEDVLKQFKTDKKRGLTREKYEKRQIEYGKNKLKDKTKEGFLFTESSCIAG